MGRWTMNVHWLASTSRPIASRVRMEAIADLENISGVLLISKRGNADLEFYSKRESRWQDLHNMSGLRENFQRLDTE